MLNFHKFTLKDTIPHKSTDVTFKKGVNVVRGPNFSGKSTIWLLLGQLVTGELPYTPKRDKDNAGSISLAFSRDDVYCEINYDLTKGRPTSLIENGCELTYKSVDDLRAKLDELLPFTLPSWQNSAYLSNDTFPYLLRGTPINRKQLFESLFDIDTDRQYKYFKGLASYLDKIEVQRDTLREVDIERVYKDDLRATRTDIDILAAKLADKEASYAKVREFIVAEEAWLKFADTGKYKHFKKTSTETLRKRLEQIDPAALYAELEQAKVYDDLLAQADARKLLVRQLADAKRRLGDKQLPLDIVQCRELLKLYAHYEAALIKYPKPPKLVDIDSSERDLDKAERRLKALQHASECPLCGSKLQGSLKTKTLAGLNSEIKSLQKSLQVANDLHDDKVDVLQHKLADLDITWAEAVEWRKSAHIWSAYIIVQELEAELTRSKSVSLPKQEPRTVEVIREDIDSCKHEAAAIEAYLEFNSKSRLASSVDATVNATVLEDMRRDLRILQDKFTEKLVEYKKYKQVQLKIAQCNYLLKIKPAITSLRNLYGPKGLRAARVRDALECYVDNLNQEARSILPKYRFFIESVESGVNLMCERPAGTSDVRRFSGAEGKLLPLMSLLALHPLLPSDKHTNLLILDEAEQGMRADTRQIFTSELLPRLQQVYESLWVVTPLEAEEFPIYVPDCTTYEYETVLREGVSSLNALS